MLFFRKESKQQCVSVEYSQLYTKEYIAVIDTETTWGDRVMSIGIVIADKHTFTQICRRYFILTPEYLEGGMYSFSLDTKNTPIEECSRAKAIKAIIQLLSKYNIDSICAYNAKFDFNHLPELSTYKWYDIMRIAAYKQYNHAIPAYLDFCNTGRLKRGYGVEPIYRMLSGDTFYNETHNAINDAIDELNIIRMLGYPFSTYENVAKIN